MNSVLVHLDGYQQVMNEAAPPVVCGGTLPLVLLQSINVSNSSVAHRNADGFD